MCCREGGRKEGFIMKKYCTKCGKEFNAVGREVICPACKQAAAEETKRAAVERAKKASWSGESVPVRISGRASTVIRVWATREGVPFAESLDELLKSTDFFKSMNEAWDEVKPYKSRRRDKHATETQDGTQTAQDGTQTAQEVKPQDVQDALVKPAKPVKQAARKAVETSTSKAAGKKVKA